MKPMNVNFFELFKFKISSDSIWRRSCSWMLTSVCKLFMFCLWNFLWRSQFMFTVFFEVHDHTCSLTVCWRWFIRKINKQWTLIFYQITFEYCRKKLPRRRKPKADNFLRCSFLRPTKSLRDCLITCSRWPLNVVICPCSLPLFTDNAQFWT